MAAALFASCARKDAGLVAAPEPQTSSTTNVHLAGTRRWCQACHLGDPPALRAEPVGLCLRCHGGGHGSSHPVGVPAGKNSRGLPVTGGRIACHTCHEVHDMTGKQHGLRLPVNALCSGCHEGY